MYTGHACQVTTTVDMDRGQMANCRGGGGDNTGQQHGATLDNNMGQHLTARGNN